MTSRDEAPMVPGADPQDRTKRLNLNDINSGLLKFCMECGKLNPNAEHVIPPRDPADYVWLREAYDSIESDAQVMAKLLTRIAEYLADRTSHTTEDVQFALDNLVDFVENVDDANDFLTLGGAAPVLDLMRDTEQPILCAAAAGVISAVVQNNQPGQKRLLKAGALPFVCADLAYFCSKHKEDPDKETAAMRLVSAAASLIREDAEAQKEFISRGGLASVWLLVDPETSKRLLVRAVICISRLAETREGCSGLEALGSYFYPRLLSLISNVGMDETVRERSALTLTYACGHSSTLKSVVSAHKAELLTLAVEETKRDASGIVSVALKGLLSAC